ncbi:peptidase S8/S53 domain-containing protein [Xylogone sp. PMI_703]|nr:peptidase S8/S53 domain-containing protein [Xylogone sp. PMI_703]
MAVLSKALAVGALLASSASAQVSYVAPAPNNATVPSNSSIGYIVELSTAGSQGVFLNAARSSGGLFSRAAVHSIKNFTSDLFNGASIVTEDLSSDDIAQIPGVVNVWPNRRHFLPPHPGRKGFPHFPLPTQSTSNYSVHGLTGVDKVQASGIKGNGIIVGIVDTGIWYPHPALGGGIGPKYKVLSGHDFIGKNSSWPNPGVPKVPDDDPLDEQGHGTHVAGILTGKSQFFTGVAPDVKIRSYKVFGTQDATDTETIIDGFLMAYADGVDLITSSIGSDADFPDNAWAEINSRISSKGVVITVAGGNSGVEGPFIGNPGSMSPSTIAVAACNPEFIPGFAAYLNIKGKQQQYISYLGNNDETFPSSVSGSPIVSLSLDLTSEDDACTPLETPTNDLSNSVVLIRASNQCSIVTQQTNLEAIGVKNILVYMDEQAIGIPATASTASFIALVPSVVGELIIPALKAKKTVTLILPSGSTVAGVYDQVYHGTPAYYSSWGPGYDLSVKPDISAPGTQIFSTWLDNDYAILSGTSMATPYVAGVASLYLSSHSKPKNLGDVQKIVGQIISSGSSMLWNDAGVSSPPIKFTVNAPVAQVGTGIINALAVVKGSTTVDTQRINLNDTTNFKAKHTIKVSNHGLLPAIYKVSVEPAGGFYALSTDTADGMSPFTNVIEEPVAMVPEVKFPSLITVLPGLPVNVDLTFTPPHGVDATRLPIYSGKVVLSGTNGDVVSIPYLGAATSLKSIDMFASTWPELGQSITIQFPLGRNNIPNGTVMSFTNTAFVKRFPVLEYVIKYGTEELRWDIYEAGWTENLWTYPPVVGKNGYLGSATYYSGSDFGGGGVLNPTPPLSFNNTTPFPITQVEHSIGGGFTAAIWIGNFANGTQIPSGQYYQRISALKPFGNRKVKGDWSVNGGPFNVTG